MLIRLACPNCRSELSYPGNAAGTRANCPRCQSAFLIPIPTATTIAEKTPEPDSFRDETPIPEQIARERPRPVYKQTPKRDEEPEPEEGTRRSGGRIRKKVKIKKGKNPNLLYLVGGGIGALLFVAGAIVLIWNMSSESKPKIKMPEASHFQIGTPEASPFPDAPTHMDIPPSWSRNANSFGYQAAWPIKGDKLGYAPSGEFSVKGEPVDSWTYTDKAAKITWSIQRTKLSPLDESDVDATLDRAVEKMKREGLNALKSEKRSIAGEPVVLVTGIQQGVRTTARISASKQQLWTATVACPEATPNDDPQIWRFLYSFKPL